MSQVDHKSSAKVLPQQKNFKAAIKLSEQYDSNLPVILSHNNTNNFLGGGGGGQGRQDFGTHTKTQFDQTFEYRSKKFITAMIIASLKHCNVNSDESQSAMAILNMEKLKVVPGKNWS